MTARFTSLERDSLASKLLDELVRRAMIEAALEDHAGEEPVAEEYSAPGIQSMPAAMRDRSL